ncbi:F-box domain-containing protein [Mycena sanguinolenta]|uniref:F-box domain-containing protein n=1 Tax=Mycena sanguinolenta TaxID=230812 RepID=A0A8H7D7B7_9AGAR|nr:F-box domain-containing protein [Mycena sanguinolenta]
MSLQELCARLSELNAVEIDTRPDLQKVSEKLQRDKILVQRQLNAVRDPIARLPLELSSEIFLRSLSPFPKPGVSHAPMLLLNVCNAWTDIALSTPDLWTAIQIEFPCTDDLAHLLPIWFLRARARPLSVFFRGDFWMWNPIVSSVIWRHGPQLGHLKTLHDCKHGDESNIVIDLFHGATPKAMPLLKHLMLQTSDSTTWQRYLPHQILDILRLAPNIIDCVLGTMWGVPESRFTGEKPTLASLRRLTFGERESINNDDLIFNHLSLPALEALSVSVRFPSAPLLRLLERSAPPLQELTMGWSQYLGMNSDYLHECLHHIPSLASFRMWEPSAEIVVNFFAALADSPSLLPNLCRLAFHMTIRSSPQITDLFWRPLLRAVSTRRMDLHVGNFLEAPPPDILAALQDLADDRSHVNGDKRDDCDPQVFDFQFSFSSRAKQFAKRYETQPVFCEQPPRGDFDFGASAGTTLG